MQWKAIALMAYVIIVKKDEMKPCYLDEEGALREW